VIGSGQLGLPLGGIWINKLESDFALLHSQASVGEMTGQLEIVGDFVRKPGGEGSGQMHKVEEFDHAILPPPSI